MSIEFRPIKESEREECLRLWYTVFHRVWEGFFERYFYGDVEWLPYYTQVAVLDGKLVSAVQTVKRTVACGDFCLTMGGIANVATLPEFRGKGYNQELLRRAIEVMEADAMDFSMLGTGINDYYAKLGFSTLPRPTWEGTIREQNTAPLSPQVWGEPSSLEADPPQSTLGQKSEVPPRIGGIGGLTVRAATGDDLPAIRDIYAVYNAKTPIAVQRYEAYWREWAKVTPEKLLPNCLVAANGFGELVGYLSMDEYKRENDGAEIVGLSNVEFGLRRGRLSQEQETAVTRELLIAAVKNSPNATRLTWSNHTDPVVSGVLRELLTELKQRENTGEMVRLLHRTNLMQSFTLAWNESWTAAGRPKGTVSFQTPYGITTIDANGSFLRIVADGNAENALPQETFFGLLFGTLALNDAETRQTENGAGQTLPLLCALFPTRSFVYWDRDGF